MQQLKRKSAPVSATARDSPPPKAAAVSQDEDDRAGPSRLLSQDAAPRTANGHGEGLEPPSERQGAMSNPIPQPDDSRAGKLLCPCRPVSTSALRGTEVAADSELVVSPVYDTSSMGDM